MIALYVEQETKVELREIDQKVITRGYENRKKVILLGKG